MNALDYCRVAAKAALAKQAEDVVVLELPEGTGLADGFTIATARNQRQVVAIVDEIEEKLRLEGVKPRHLEGYPRREWILMDYGPFVVHVFTPKSREFYDLERLWGGAKREEVKD
ncbi:MAG: ribosome silencing factor [Vicinamibacteria bacterium]